MTTNEKKRIRRIALARLSVATVMLGLFALAISGIAPHFLRLQFAPALLRAATVMSIGAIVILALLVLGTFLFGRFYCSTVCPLGLLQDIIGKVTRGKQTALRRETWVRYLLTGIVFGALGSGWTWGLLLLDPYSISGRIAVGVTLTGFFTLGALIVLCVWRKRFFCATLCPVGVILGLLSKWGLYRLRLSKSCIKCGRCAKNCPSGCIDLEAKTIDNERCVRCMSCISSCPTGAIALQRGATPPVNTARRDFLAKGALLLAGVGTGIALTKVGKEWVEAKLPSPTLVLPPGAGNHERFSAKCTGCQACIAACPAKIIIPTAKGFAPIAVDLSRGACDYNCNACGQACPTGAIAPLALEEKRQIKLAEAKLDAKKCKVFQDDEPCGKCAEVCPMGAITLRPTGAPRPVKVNHCLGCAMCVVVCPSSHGKALTILPIPEQGRARPSRSKLRPQATSPATSPTASPATPTATSPLSPTEVKL